jgi:hypothetical protein
LEPRIMAPCHEPESGVPIANAGFHYPAIGMSNTLSVKIISDMLEQFCSDPSAQSLKISERFCDPFRVSPAEHCPKGQN